MQRVHRHAEAGAEAGQGLRRQSDLRHQHQRLLAAGEAVGDRVQVDLGLAAAGDAVEQQRGEAGMAAERIDRGLLFRIEHRSRLRHGCVLRGRHGDAFDQAALGQRARGAAPVLAGRIERVFVARADCSSSANRRGLPARSPGSAVRPASVSRQAQPWVSGSGSPRRSAAGSAVASTSPSGACR